MSGRWLIGATERGARLPLPPVKPIRLHDGRPPRQVTLDNPSPLAFLPRQRADANPGLLPALCPGRHEFPSAPAPATSPDTHHPPATHRPGKSCRQPLPRRRLPMSLRSFRLVTLLIKAIPVSSVPAPAALGSVSIAGGGENKRSKRPRCCVSANGRCRPFPRAIAAGGTWHRGSPPSRPAARIGSSRTKTACADLLRQSRARVPSVGPFRPLPSVGFLPSASLSGSTPSGLPFSISFCRLPSVIPFRRSLPSVPSVIPFRRSLPATCDGGSNRSPEPGTKALGSSGSQQDRRARGELSWPPAIPRDSTREQDRTIPEDSLAETSAAPPR